MIDVDYELRVAVIAKLQGNVTWEGQAVPVRGEFVNSSLPHPYIYIPTQSMQNDSAKQYFASDNNINIEIVTRSETGLDLPAQVDNISNQVMQLLAVKDQIDMPQPAGLGMVDFQFVSSQRLRDYDGVYMYLRKILIFNALVDEG